MVHMHNMSHTHSMANGPNHTHGMGNVTGMIANSTHQPHVHGGMNHGITDHSPHSEGHLGVRCIFFLWIIDTTSYFCWLWRSVTKTSTLVANYVFGFCYVDTLPAIFRGLRPRNLTRDDGTALALSILFFCLQHTMKMYFNFDMDIHVLFFNWLVSTEGRLAASCVGIFFMSLLYEGLKVLRTYLLNKAVRPVVLYLFSTTPPWSICPLFQAPWL